MASVFAWSLLTRSPSISRGLQKSVRQLSSSLRCPLGCLTHSGNLMNDEYCGSDFVCHSSAVALVGRVKQKLAPRGELSAAHKRPPCDSTIERLMRSPIPVP